VADVEEALIELQNDWMDAWRRDDRALLEELLAPEFTLTSARSDQIVDRVAWLRLLDQVHAESFEYSDFLVQVFGDAAVVKSRLTQVASVAGQPWNETFMLTDVWVRRDGRWQVVARHSSIPPAKAFTE
jgi:ketosteroid isomerase-like protein